MTGQRAAGRAAKNIILVLLVVLLVLLCFVSWLSGMNIREMPADSALRIAYEKLSGGAVGYEMRASGVAAAEPVQLALSVEGTLYGVQYDPAEIGVALEAVRGLWAQVLSGGAPMQTSEQELTAALAGGDSALLRYHGGIPLGVIAGWMGGKWNNDLAVEALIYAADERQLFIRAADGALYASFVKANADMLAAAQREFHGTECTFAGGAYAVYPETLLFTRETLTLPLLKTAEPRLLDPHSGAGLESLLAAFGYTPYVNRYEEQSGAVRVFVDEASTLRVSNSGLVQYAAAGEDSTVRAYDAAEGRSALDAQLDCARLILDGVLRAAETGTAASLYAVQREDTRTTLVFLQMYGGVPLLGQSDFATFVFDGGALASATIRLQCVTAAEQTQAVLPALQAAAGASGGQLRGLLTAYRERGGVLTPERFFLQG